MACDINLVDTDSVKWNTPVLGPNGLEYSATANTHAVTLEDIDPSAGTGGDDTAAFYGAVDKALADRTRVQLGGKTYNFDQPVLLDTNRETIMIEGCGTESKRFNDPPYTDGSVLNSRISTGDAFTFKGVQTQIRDMTLAGVTNGWVMANELYQMTSVKNLHIDAAGPSTNGIRANVSFTNIYENIDIYKRDRDSVGIGFWHNTTTAIAGGNSLFTNMTASYFKNNLEFGQEDLYTGPNQRRNNTLINVQGRFGETGIRFGSGYGHTEVINSWAENNTYAQIQVHSEAGTIWFRGGEMGGTTGHGLVLGLDPAIVGAVANKPICPVTVQNAKTRVWGAGFSGVRIFPPDPALYPIERDLWHEFDLFEMQNNGGARFLTDVVDQMNILVRRQKYIDTTNVWGPGSLIRTAVGATGYTNYAATATAPNPMHVQTSPLTQI